MGSFKKITRPISQEERRFLATLSDDNRHSMSTDSLDSIQDVVEYQIEIDQVLKPDCGYQLPPDIEPYILVVNKSTSIGFEYCFMDGALVSGGFPKDFVRIAFGVLRDNAMSLAISYAWEGSTLSVQDIAMQECPQPMSTMMSVFRSDWIETAIDQMGKGSV